jgi:hypothetical protein
MPHGFTFGNSSVAWKDPPRRDPASDSGLYVSSIQLDGNLHFNLGPSGNLALWAPISYGLSDYAFAAAPCMRKPDAAGVFTGGVGVAYTQPLGERWHIGMSLETMLSFIPSHIHSTCVANCEYAAQVTDHEDTDVMLILRTGFMAGVRLWVFRIFAGLYLRNHPSNTQVTHSITYAPTAADGDIEFGPLYVILGAGLEAEIGPFVSVLAQVFQPLPLYRHDLVYGPIIGAMIDIHGARD